MNRCYQVFLLQHHMVNILLAPGSLSCTVLSFLDSTNCSCSSASSTVNVLLASPLDIFLPAPCEAERHESLLPSPLTMKEAVPILPGIIPYLPRVASIAPFLVINNSPLVPVT